MVVSTGASGADESRTPQASDMWVGGDSSTLSGFEVRGRYLEWWYSSAPKSRDAQIRTSCHCLSGGRADLVRPLPDDAERDAAADSPARRTDRARNARTRRDGAAPSDRGRIGPLDTGHHGVGTVSQLPARGRRHRARRHRHRVERWGVVRERQ